MRKVITLEKETKLLIEVYHIGYSNQGEGSIFILHTSTDKVLYSLAIDCYEEAKINKTDEILKQWKLEKKLNMFIWTHPHDDHSIGIDKIIEKYCNNKSIICMANILGIKNKCSEVSRNNIEYIQTLTARKRVKNKWHINSMVHFPEIIDEIFFNGEGEIQKLTVQCIAPFSEIGGMEPGKCVPNFNMMGIACILKVEMKKENINFLFAGDMEHYTVEKLIEEVDENVPNVYNYIKIPHHGSENVMNMVEFLNLGKREKSEFASTSVFTKQGLPKRNVLDSYKKVVEQVACTSNIEENRYGTGIINLKFDITDKKVYHNFDGTATYV